MAFPETRLTLIGRISAGGSEEDWQQFLHDYWGPVCRFAARHANLSEADAEDVAAKTFEAILTNRLVQRWQKSQNAKLRTLLCGVIRNVLSNRARVEAGRKRLIDEEIARGGEAIQAYTADATDELTDMFYAAWVDDVVQTCVEGLMQDFHKTGKGDYFRVLYGRLCEGMTMPEISRALDIKVTDAENYLKSARKKLAEKLESHVRKHVARYCHEQSPDVEFEEEWQRLGEFLKQHGGLEQTIANAYRQQTGAFSRDTDSFSATRESLSRAIQKGGQPK